MAAERIGHSELCASQWPLGWRGVHGTDPAVGGRASRVPRPTAFCVFLGSVCSGTGLDLAGVGARTLAELGVGVALDGLRGFHELVVCAGELNFVQPES